MSTVVARSHAALYHVQCNHCILTFISLHRTSYGVAHFNSGPLPPNPNSSACGINQRFLYKDRPVIWKSNITSSWTHSLPNTMTAQRHIFVFFVLNIRKQHTNICIIAAVMPKLIASHVIWIFIFHIQIVWLVSKCNNLHKVHPFPDICMAKILIFIA